jgi:hypothetical protein
MKVIIFDTEWIVWFNSIPTHLQMLISIPLTLITLFIIFKLFEYFRTPSTPY